MVVVNLLFILIPTFIVVLLKSVAGFGRTFALIGVKLLDRRVRLRFTRRVIKYFWRTVSLVRRFLVTRKFRLMSPVMARIIRLLRRITLGWWVLIMRSGTLRSRLVSPRRIGVIIVTFRLFRSVTRTLGYFRWRTRIRRLLWCGFPRLVVLPRVRRVPVGWIPNRIIVISLMVVKLRLRRISVPLFSF